MVVELIRNDGLTSQVVQVGVEATTGVHNRIAVVVNIDDVVIGLSGWVSEESDEALASHTRAVAVSSATGSWAELGILHSVVNSEVAARLKVRVVCRHTGGVVGLVVFVLDVLLLIPGAEVLGCIKFSEKRCNIALFDASEEFSD